MSETRRDRLRAATMREITQTARRILVSEGPQAVTLRAIAREMGMTAPALYRYFDSHQELIRHVIGDLFTELTEELHGALHMVGPDDLAGKFLFGWTFLAMFQELWEKSPFPVPADDEIDPSLREQLARYRDGLGSALPLGTLLVFVQCWIRLQGIVSLEAFGHLTFALDDAGQMLELTLAEIGPRLGLTYYPEA